MNRSIKVIVRLNLFALVVAAIEASSMNTFAYKTEIEREKPGSVIQSEKVH